MSGLLKKLDSALEASFYPDVPDPDDSALEQKALMKRACTALSDPLDWPTRKTLEKLTISDLYELLERMEGKKSAIQLIRESVQGQIALLQQITRAIANVRGGQADILEAKRIIHECESAFLERLRELGLTVMYESEVSPEELEQKPALILATHQGGGGENYIHEAITGITGRLVVKDSLMKIPFIRDGLEAQEAVAVRREMLKNKDTRHLEIDHISRKIVEQLASGGNMFVFFEGTRSRNGEIAATDKRKAWARDLLSAVDRLWEKQNEAAHAPREFQKLLLVFNTMTAMPDAPEERVFLTRFRTTGTTLSAKLVHADDLALEETEDPYDPATLFGKARSLLKEMLIRIILEKEGR